jgi:6-phosphogluconolactonase/glucosamine-6-phosphate isomerase/deaminase
MSKETSNNKVTVKLQRERECKGSVMFFNDDPKVAVRNVYISRTVPAVETAKEVIVTIEFPKE